MNKKECSEKHTAQNNCVLDNLDDYDFIVGFTGTEYVQVARFLWEVSSGQHLAKYLADKTDENKENTTFPIICELIKGITRIIREAQVIEHE